MLRSLLAIAFFVATAALGQTFPTKPIHIFTSEPGGGNDFAARMIGVGLGASLGQQIVVENRGAGAGVIAAETVARAPADGYTLLLYGSNIWLLPFLKDGLPYDPIKDFTPVTLAVRAPAVLVVHPALPVKSTRDLIALAKARPGQLNYSAGATGSATQIATELFKSMARIDIVHIRYRGNGPALNALIAGEVQLAFATPGSVASHIRSGRLHALAVTSAEPSVLLPGLPTVASAGVPGYEAQSIVGVFAPAKTSSSIITRLNEAIVSVLQQADVKQKFLNVGVETVGSSPDVFGATVKAEMSRLGKVIKEAGIRDE